MKRWQEKAAASCEEARQDGYATGLNTSTHHALPHAQPKITLNPYSMLRDSWQQQLGIMWRDAFDQGQAARILEIHALTSQIDRKDTRP